MPIIFFMRSFFCSDPLLDLAGHLQFEQPAQQQIEKTYSPRIEQQEEQVVADPPGEKIAGYRTQ